MLVTDEGSNPSITPNKDRASFKFQKPGEVRTRFAPSPTGYLHIGSVRTALFNYLFAKKNKGVFVLRIEDTDIERSTPEYEKDIIESLKWLGIEWDEFYRQSERTNIYRKYLEKLLDENKAYYCFCSEEEIEAQRQYQLSIGEPPRYSGKCANLSPTEVQRLLSQGKKSVIRFRVPAKKIVFTDLIRGEIEFDTSLIGDIVIAKDIKTPLYNFACVVDDFEMKVSHVIRGEEHISNTPKQILLQEALNFPLPQYVHLPIILASDRTKLSKRHGAVGISEYKKEGYLAEALVNFIAFLGWNPGGEREIYSMPSLIKEFSLEKVKKGGAIFNIKRLDFLNSFYIRQKSVEKLTELCLSYLVKAGLIEELKSVAEGSSQLFPPSVRGVDKDSLISHPKDGQLFQEKKPGYKIKKTGELVTLDWLKKIVFIYQERLIKLSEISELTDFFFKDKLEYEKELLRWREINDKEIKLALDKLEKILTKIEVRDFNKENLGKKLLPGAEEFAKKLGKMGDRGYLLWPLRVALTGKKASAGPFEIAELLGKEKTLKRIKEAKELLAC